MKKMIVIDRCWQCKEMQSYIGSSECIKDVPRVIPDVHKIPDWCPLQDAPEEDNEKTQT
jgi:hypothetical protein